MGRQRVNAGAVVNTIPFHAGVVPGSLTHSADAGHNTRRDLCRDTHFTACVKDADHIAVGDPALLRIDRVQPHFLATGGLQHVNVAVGGMGT